MNTQINWGRVLGLANVVVLAGLVWGYSVEYRKARLAETRILWLAERSDRLAEDVEFEYQSGKKMWKVVKIHSQELDMLAERVGLVDRKK